MKVKETACIGYPGQKIAKVPNATTAFEKDYWNIQNRISCGNVTLHSSAVKSLIVTKQWVNDFNISTILSMIYNESIVTFDTTFLTILRRAKHHKVIQSASDFLQYQCSPSGLARLIIRVRHCQIALIPLFDRDHTRNGSHWRLAALEKKTALIPVYDSMHELWLFKKYWKTLMLLQCIQIQDKICAMLNGLEFGWHQLKSIQFSKQNLMTAGFLLCWILSRFSLDCETEPNFWSKLRKNLS